MNAFYTGRKRRLTEKILRPIGGQLPPLPFWIRHRMVWLAVVRCQAFPVLRQIVSRRRCVRVTVRCRWLANRSCIRESTSSLACFTHVASRPSSSPTLSFQTPSGMTLGWFVNKLEIKLEIDAPVEAGNKPISKQIHKFYMHCITVGKILHNEHINKLARKLSHFSFIDVKYSVLFYSWLVRLRLITGFFCHIRASYFSFNALLVNVNGVELK